MGDTGAPQTSLADRQERFAASRDTGYAQVALAGLDPLAPATVGGVVAVIAYQMGTRPASIRSTYLADDRRPAEAPYYADHPEVSLGDHFAMAAYGLDSMLAGDPDAPIPPAPEADDDDLEAALVALESAVAAIRKAVGR